MNYLSAPIRGLLRIDASTSHGKLFANPRKRAVGTQCLINALIINVCGVLVRLRDLSGFWALKRRDTISHTVAFGSSVEKISPMLNLSDVLTYLMAWQNGQTNLRILLSTSDGRFSLDCTLLGFWDTGISLQLSGKSNSIDLNLVGYDFEFLDESAANILREEIPAHQVYVRGLRANRSPGETLFILEIAASSESRPIAL